MSEMWLAEYHSGGRQFHVSILRPVGTGWCSSALSQLLSLSEPGYGWNAIAVGPYDHVHAACDMLANKLSLEVNHEGLKAAAYTEFRKSFYSTQAADDPATAIAKAVNRLGTKIEKLAVAVTDHAIKERT